MWRQGRQLEDELLDLRGENIHAAHDHHVVAAPSDFFHAPHGARRAGQQAREVARAVTHDGERLLGQAGEDQFADLPIRQRLARARVHHLGVEMVFPDRRAVLGLDAFIGHARTDHFAQAINIHRIDVHALLDGAAHLVGPGLGAKDAQAQRTGGRVQALALHFVGDGQHVAGRDHDDVGREVGDELHLAFGLAAAEGHDGQAQALGAVMRAQTTGEQAVAVAHMHQIAGPGSGRAHAARDTVRPGVDIVLRVTHHRRFARGAAGGMNAHAALARHGEHAKGVIRTQILLGGEGELAQVGQTAAVIRVYARGAEHGAIGR